MSEWPDAVRTITALRVCGRGGESVELYLDGALHVVVAYGVVLEAGLRVDDTLDERRLAALLAADECWRAKQSALALLSVRARARSELGSRLRRKGYGEAAVAHALAETDRLELLDDAAFAAAWVRDRLKLRPRGERALVQELVRRGVSADIARAAVGQVMETAGTSDEALCRAAAERWVRSRAGGETDRVRLLRRMTAFLARRGYPPATIRRAVDDTLGSERSA